MMRHSSYKLYLFVSTQTCTQPVQTVSYTNVVGENLNQFLCVRPSVKAFLELCFEMVSGVFFLHILQAQAFLKWLSIFSAVERRIGGHCWVSALGKEVKLEHSFFFSWTNCGLFPPLTGYVLFKGEEAFCPLDKSSFEREAQTPLNRSSLWFYFLAGWWFWYICVLVKREYSRIDKYLIPTTLI